MDEKESACRVVDSPLAKNARALSAELEWLFKLLGARARAQSCKERGDDLSDISPPRLSREGSMYGYLIDHYGLYFTERAVLILSLLPHVRPGALEVFLSAKGLKAGCRAGASHPGPLPTGETALFMLAGDDLEKRLECSYVFDNGHFFTTHGILSLTGTERSEPRLSGLLTLSNEIIELVTTGVVSGPAFGADFPAKKIETPLDWEDLVLDDYCMSQVLEIKDWLDYGDILLNELKLKRKVKPGFRSLFHGPPGTGKTLAASLIGKVTKKEVFRIDLSMVLSKFIGETEKNLEKVFSQAERKDWILFFDESEALFGKRTNINSSHDRFANQEVSYLLQRVEDYPGVVILASNLKQNLDEAFTRRFQSIIHFPMPRQGERLKIWQKAFSEKTVLENDEDLQMMAERYELSGGSIMNVVRYATLRAIKSNTRVISTESLLDGIRREFHKEGRTF